MKVCISEQIKLFSVYSHMMKIEDNLGRKFEKLRISLLNTCNFSCVYCVSEELTDLNGHSVLKKEEQLGLSEFVQQIEAIHRLNPLKSVRLTGGEPLLYRDLIPLIREIKKLGIDDIRLTTNAYYLKGHADKLFDAGLKSVNISVDAINPEVFNRIARFGNTKRVFEGIESAAQSGMKVKLNTVVMRGKNENEIVPLLDYAASLGVKIRYLELMKMGHLYHSNNGHFFSEKEILETIQNKYSIEQLPRVQSETARYWKASNGGTFGIIANESTPFCHDCNRLRMDSNGKFYGCLSNSRGEKLTPYLADDEKLAGKLKELLLLKQPVRFHGSELSMRNIGG